MPAPYTLPAPPWPKALWLLLGGNTLLHMVLGSMLGLSGDEAHYAMYAANLALSYYDHPPMVGWIQWPLVALNMPDGALRLIPQALWIVSALWVFAIARRLHSLFDLHLTRQVSPDASGLWAVAAFSLAPLLHILGIGLLPDTLLMTCSAGIILQTLRMLEPVALQRVGNWLFLGALLGLAGLSKYTAIFAAIAVVVSLTFAHGLRWLALTGPWLALLVALFMVSPVFIWNAQHDWISFAYQLKHGAGSHWQFSAVIVFLIVQLLVFGPLLLWGFVKIRTVLFVRHKTPEQNALVSLLGFFALPFAVLAYLSGGGSSLPHWTASAWVALAPFAGMGLALTWEAGLRTAIKMLVAFQMVFCIALYALMLMAGPPWVSSQKATEPINPFTDFHGWAQTGRRAQQLAQQHQVKHLAVQNWTLASRLAWYARPVPVHVLDPAFDQFSLWSGDLPAGADAVLMDWSQMAYQLPVGAGKFNTCEPLETLPVEVMERQVASFRLYLCKGWGGQPAPVRQD